jgi:hypothetical protein
MSLLGKKEFQKPINIHVYVPTSFLYVSLSPRPSDPVSLCHPWWCAPFSNRSLTVVCCHRVSKSEKLLPLPENQRCLSRKK